MRGKFRTETGEGRGGRKGVGIRESIEGEREKWGGKRERGSGGRKKGGGRDMRVLYSRRNGKMGREKR